MSTPVAVFAIVASQDRSGASHHLIHITTGPRVALDVPLSREATQGWLGENRTPWGSSDLGSDPSPKDLARRGLFESL